MRDTFYKYVLFLAILIFANNISILGTTLDSLINETKKEHTHTEKAKLAVLIINQYLRQDKLADAQDWVNYFKNIQSNDYELNYQKESAQTEILYFGSMQNLALNHIQKGLKIALAQNDSLGIADAYGYMSYIYEELDSIQLAKKNSLLALNYFPAVKGERIRELLDKGQIVNQLAQMCVKLKEYNEAKKYNHQSRILAIQEGNIRAEIMSYATEGNIYFGLAQDDSARFYFQKTYTLAKLKDRRDISLWMLGKLILLSKNEKEANEKFNQGINLIEKQKVASLFSLFFLKDAKTYFQKFNNINLLTKVQNKIIEIEKKNYDYGLKMAQNISAKYIDHQQEIVKLTEEKNRKNKQLFTFQLISAILLLSSIIGIIVWYNKNKKQHLKQKIKQEQKIQKERSSIAREMHDELGGNLSRMQFVLHELKEKEKDSASNILINKMDNLYASSVENMNDIIWSLQQEFNNLEELQVYIKQYINKYNDRHNAQIGFETEFVDKQIFINTLNRRNIYLIVKELLENLNNKQEPLKINLDFKPSNKLFLHFYVNEKNSKEIFSANAIQKANKLASEIHTELQWTTNKMVLEVYLKQ